MIEEKSLQELRDIFIQETGAAPEGEALETLGMELLNLFNHVYQPVKKEWLDHNYNDGRKRSGGVYGHDTDGKEQQAHVQKQENEGRRPINCSTAKA